MRHRRLPIVLALAAIGMLVVATADPASATVPTVKSGLGAGYLSQPGVWSIATVTFKQPTITCGGDVHLLLGVWAYRDGVHTSSAGVVAGCAGSTPFYSMEVHTPEGDDQATATPGDTFVATVFKGTSNTRVTVRDVTAKTTLTKTVLNYKEADNQVLLGARGQGSVAPFSSVHFSNSKVDGVALGNTPITREVLKGAFDIEIGTSAVNPSGLGFTITFKNSN